MSPDRPTPPATTTPDATAAGRRRAALLALLPALTSVLGAALLSGLLAGCANPGAPHAAAPLADPARLGLADAGATPAVPAQWWRELGDPALDALIEQALAGQPSLQAAAARVARAEAAVQASESATAPQVGAGLDVTRQRYSETSLYPPPIAGSQRTSATLQLSGGILLDFFGRHAAALRAALGQQRAAEAELAAARVLLSSRVAQAYVGLARLFSQREVAERTLQQREALLGLTRQRVQAGFDTRVELRQAEAAVPEVRQQIEALDEQIALARHQLAVLAGQAPQALGALKPALAPLQLQPLPARLGADLLGRRADIVAARWRVEAAGEEVQSARAQFYPDVNLIGFAGLSSLGLDRLISLDSRNLGLGPALRLPVFDGGRLRAQLHGREAERDAAVAAYNGALLEALREVADAIASLQSLQRQQAEQAQAQAAAEGAYDLAQQRYRAGLGTYLTVLSAESGVLAQRRLGADLRARALDARIALTRALGGGWQPTEEGLRS